MARGGWWGMHDSQPALKRHFGLMASSPQIFKVKVQGTYLLPLAEEKGQVHAECEMREEFVVI